MSNALTNNGVQILTKDQYEVMKISKEQENEVKVLKRFDVEELNRMFSNGASFNELVGYCKNTVVNHFNYCTECNSFIDQEDVIPGTDYYKCPTCKALNKI